MKTDSEQQITKIKSDTEKEIKLAELRSQEKILLLKNQFEAEKELRAKTAANESTAHSIRVATCDEIRKIRDSMSTDIPAIRFNDYRIDDALTSLQAADNKRDSYLTEVGLLALRAALPKKISEDFRTAKREYYSAVLQGYNAEFRTSCAK